MITIALSTYMILGSERLYRWLKEPLRVFERATPFSELGGSTSGPARVDVILLGLGRFGGAIQRRLQPHNLAILGIDFDPQALRLAAAQGLPVQYGDDDLRELRQLQTAKADLEWRACSQLAWPACWARNVSIQMW